MSERASPMYVAFIDWQGSQDPFAAADEEAGFNAGWSAGKRELAEELRTPMKCGHPKMFGEEMDRYEDLSTGEVQIFSECTVCAEIEAAVKSMRKRAAETAHNEKHGDNRVIEERIRALPLDAPPQTGGGK